MRLKRAIAHGVLVTIGIACPVFLTVTAYWSGGWLCVKFVWGYTLAMSALAVCFLWAVSDES